MKKRRWLEFLPNKKTRDTATSKVLLRCYLSSSSHCWPRVFLTWDIGTNWGAFRHYIVHAPSAARPQQLARCGAAWPENARKCDCSEERAPCTHSRGAPGSSDLIISCWHPPSTIHHPPSTSHHRSSSGWISSGAETRTPGQQRQGAGRLVKGRATWGMGHKIVDILCWLSFTISTFRYYRINFI